jgi:arginine/ornithine transport system permease protein
LVRADRLRLNSAAYTTEIFRGAIEATPHGEVEAAKAMGMSKDKVMRRIVLPSALRRRAARLFATK